MLQRTDFPDHLRMTRVSASSPSRSPRFILVSRFRKMIRITLITLAAFGAIVGFVVGSQSEAAGYNPQTFALGASTLLAVTCIAIAYLGFRIRRLKSKVRNIVARNHALTDRNWELKEAEERARSLIDSQGDLIVRRDTQGRITFVSATYCKFFQRSQPDLMRSDFAPSVLAQSDVGIEDDGTKLYDQQVETPIGPRWIAWRESMVRMDDRQSADTQFVGRDVTDRVVAERALGEARDQADAANRAKSRFLAMVSHEIRTPLNGILGMAELLRDTNLSAEQTTYIRAIKTSGDALLSLIEEILDLSKIESGKINLDERPFALAQLVEDVVELLAPRAQARELEIVASIDERLPACVLGDAARLRQILLNLAGNAIKFTSKGGVAIFVEPGIWDGEIAFRVQDTGIGIAPEAASRIFREFEQADSSTTRKYGGTGLGLAISKRIIDRMNGRINLQSVPGEGSTFEVHLPLTAALDRAPVFAKPDLTNRAVLILAPNSFESEILARHLGRWGAQICAVSDADIATALLPERVWDFLIIDDRIGMEAIAPLLQAAMPYIDRRMVLITPASRHELPSLKDIGFTDYLIKPLRAASLAARLCSDGVDFVSDIPALAPVSHIARADHETQHGPGQEASHETGPAALSILVAEDNDINALLVRALLTKMGHRPVMTQNGVEAFESWLAASKAGTPYDLVLMDVQMPERDGMEAARQIRACEQEHGWPRTPIIALTANTLLEDKEQCLNAGMDSFITKPLARDQLDELLVSIHRKASLAA